MCLRESDDQTINIGVHEKHELVDGTQIQKNKFVSVGTFEKNQIKVGIQLALNIGLLNK